MTPPVVGADLRAALVASCLRGALPPVDLRAVCLVRACAEREVGHAGMGGQAGVKGGGTALAGALTITVR